MRISVSSSGRPEGSFAAWGGGWLFSVLHCIIFRSFFFTKGKKKCMCVRRGEVGGLGGFPPVCFLAVLAKLFFSSGHCWVRLGSLSWACDAKKVL